MVEKIITGLDPDEEGKPHAITKVEAPKPWPKEPPKETGETKDE